VQEAENQIITHYEVFAERPADSALLVPAVEEHRRRFGRAPYLAAADAGCYSQRDEKTIQAMGVKRVAIPNRSPRSGARRRWNELNRGALSVEHADQIEQPSNALRTCTIVQASRNHSFCDGK